MSQPYPGAYPVPQATPKYRPLRRTAMVSIALMGLTAIAAVIQSIVLWTSYEDVKRFVYGLLSEDEVDRGIETIAGTGPLLDVVNYLFLGTGIAFVIWLWQARENTEVLKPAFAYQGGYGSASGAHRHAQGWTVGGWVCPIVQFWYPLQVVEDVVTASEPQQQPGVARSGQLRALLYTWWASWCAFWVILVGGGGFAVVSFIVWIVRLVDRTDAADATGNYVDIYDLQDFMVRVALAVNIGFTVATVLLIIAGVTVSLLLFRVTGWQDARGRDLGATLPAQSSSGPGHYGAPQYGQQPGVGRPVDGPPQYAPRPAYGQGHSQQYGSGPGQPPAAAPPGTFPSYGGGQHQQPPGGATPWQQPQ